MKYSFGHVCFFVQDKEKMADFYCNKLGLKKMFEQEFPGSAFTAIYVRIAKGQFLELIGNMPHEEKSKSGFGHLCLHTDNIHEVHNELAGKGLSVTDVEMGAAKCLKFYVDDPEGNTLEMMQLLEDSLQTIHDYD
jgi:catechol 2,3-dioxygenase-like lactoylglutathione lyase family enzyme